MYAVFSRRVANPLAVFRLRWLGGWLLALVVGLLVAVPAWSQDDFLDPDDAFVLSAAMGSPERVDIHFKVAPEYYMYQERLEAVLEPETDASRLGELGLPPALVKYDITFEKDMPVYYGEYTLEIPVEAGADQPLTLTLTSQGCADAGLCYTPAEHVFTLTPTAEGYTLDGDGVVDAVPALADSTPPEAMQAADDTDAGGLFATGADDATASPDADLSTASDSAPSSGLDALMNLGDTGLAAWLGQAGIGKIVALSFVFGLLLSFTPCVLPMVPILLAILAGTDRQETLSRWRGFSLAAIFVLGMSLVYTVLGVAAGLVGASLAVWLQTPWVLTLFAILLGLFALAMFDVYTLQAPAALQNRLNERLNRIPGGRAGGVFVMGMVSALIVGPCVAAPLAGVLLFISQTGDIVLGGSALFAMAWGQGVLLLIVGLSSGLLMPRAGAWMQGIKTLFGLLLLATAWWMVSPVLPLWVIMLGWALLALAAAGLLAGVGQAGTESSGQSHPVWRVFRLSVAAIMALWAIMLVVSVAAGGRDLTRPLAPFVAGQASGAGAAVSGTQSAAKPVFTEVHSEQELDHVLANTSQPVMLDFYADWCVSCIQMEKFTFSDPAVAERMARFTLVQADVTRNSPEHRALLKRFDLFGPPGIIFFDPDGTVRSEERVVGFKDAAAFGAILDQVLAP